MSDIKLGETPPDDARRDAFHIAVAPVVAGETLKPGDHVGFHEDGRVGLVFNPADELGIVDPYRKTKVQVGEKFWLCLYQRTVTGMRHHWEHPAFKDDEDKPKNESEEYLRKVCAEHYRGSFEEMLREAAGGSVHFGDDEWYGSEDSDEFFRHYAIYTGTKITDGYFSCAC